MSDIIISKDTIESKLSKLKTDTLKSPGKDQLHPRVLYETRDVISYPLFLIFQKSLALGKLPSDWKLAEVTALYKKGPKPNRANYRPVSLTSVCCKLLGSFIRDDIMKYLTDNKLISSRQYSFIKGKSIHLFSSGFFLRKCLNCTSPPSLPFPLPSLLPSPSIPLPYHPRPFSFPSPLPSSPFPSPPLPVPSLHLPLEVGLLIAARGSGGSALAPGAGPGGARPPNGIW